MEGPLLRPLPWWRQRSGGLTMDQTYHEPVLVRPVVELFAPVADGTIVDATLGGGGHALALLERYPSLHVIGIDRDPDAVAHAPVHPRLRVHQANFKAMAEVIADDGSGEPTGAVVVDGVLMDLGVSSHQFDTPARGFSYRNDGPIDMRMGPDAGVDAAEIVNTWSRHDLARLFRRYGEERFADRIADAIVAGRPFDGTGALAAAIADAVPAAARRKGHPARRSFQALRIAVNDELGALGTALETAIAALRPGGRLIVISYHSLEDRAVKQRFAAGAIGCTCPPDLPVCGCGNASELRLLGRIMPSAEEIARNPRARSAVLRAAEKVAS
jgi:16S rRNA (cytosine1402-N4)-methyltransferase